MATMISSASAGSPGRSAVASSGGSGAVSIYHEATTPRRQDVMRRRMRSEELDLGSMYDADPAVHQSRRGDPAVRGLPGRDRAAVEPHRGLARPRAAARLLRRDRP